MARAHSWTTRHCQPSCHHCTPASCRHNGGAGGALAVVGDLAGQTGHAGRQLPHLRPHPAQHLQHRPRGITSSSSSSSPAHAATDCWRGNIFRGVAGGSVGMDRATADYMGMLATVMNSLALADALDKAGLTARVMSAIGIDQVVEPYVRPKALQYLEEGKVVVFAAGTGNPFFTTDTAAALRGSEIGAEIVLKATKVDGIYTADPKKDPAATRFDKISFNEVISKNLAVMDATAFALCRDQKLPINVFSIFKAGALKRVVCGEDEGTLVYC